MKILLLYCILSLGNLLPKDINILNVSYDPTREFYTEYNSLFIKNWKNKSSDNLKINQSHGGSGKQARSVIDGLEADVVTLALAYDIEIIATKGLIPQNWQKNLTNNSSPYTSTIVFVVKKGNPKGIKDWDDLIKEGIKVITPNPKTSGGARWNYLAAYGFAKKKFKDADKVTEYMRALYKNVPVLDSGARGSSNTFAKNGIGDVLLAWENEAFLILAEMGKDKFDIVLPSISILAEPPVAVVEKNALKHGTIEISLEYLKTLYTEEAQELAVKHGYRPFNPAILKKYESKFPKINLLTIEKDFGGWSNAHKEHFSDGAGFDKIYAR